MKRRLFTILSAISLLLFAAVVVLWVRSYWTGHYIQLYRNGERLRAWVLTSHRGSLICEWIRIDKDLTKMDVEDLVVIAEDNAEGYRSRFDSFASDASRYDVVEAAENWGGVAFMGFAAARELQGPSAFGRTLMRDSGLLSAPHWFIAVLFGITPLLYVRRVRQRQSESASGLCPSCGYDLRATPERCPECGHVVSPA